MRSRAVAMIAVVGLAGALGSACEQETAAPQTTIVTTQGSTGPPSATGTSAPSPVATSVAPSPSPPPPSVPAGATPMPATETKLEPGMYSYPGFGPGLTLRVGKGWMAGHQVGDFFDVDRPDAVVVFAAVGFVYDEQGVRRTVDGMSPHDAAATLAANHDLGAGPVQPATIGGVQGTSVELTPRAADNIFGRTVVYSVATDRAYRVAFVREGGQLLVVMAVAIHRPPTKAFAEAEPVIRSVRFA